jgi:hypothetical protein
VTATNIPGIENRDAPEGGRLEVLLFGFLGGACPIIAQHFTKVLSSEIAVMTNYKVFAAAAVFGIFGIIFARMSGEKVCQKHLLLEPRLRVFCSVSALALQKRKR